MLEPRLKKQTSPKPPANPTAFSEKTILLCISGSIAAYRACELVRELRKRGARVFCLMTESAKKFVTPITFRALSGNPVYSDPFSETEDWNIIHTDLADRADLILIAPATADLIARLACGFADDLVTSVVLASRRRILVVPAMNDRMYTHPATQVNLGKLLEMNYEVMKPIEGDLVCGRTAIGHIPSLDAILSRAELMFSRPNSI